MEQFAPNIDLGSAKPAYRSFLPLVVIVIAVSIFYFLIFGNIRSLLRSPQTIQSIFPTLYAGGKVSVVMTGNGFTYAADGDGNPDQLNRAVVSQGTELCAVGFPPNANDTGVQFIKVITPSGDTGFVRTYMLGVGGHACATP